MSETLTTTAHENRDRSTSEQSPSDAARAANQPTAWPQRLDVIGVPISATTYEEAVGCILQAASRRESSVVSCHAVHAVVSTAGDTQLQSKVEQFQMVCPDGQPVRWALRWLHGVKLSDRVYGPELTWRLCQAAARKDISVYFYGSTDETLAALSDNLRERIPALRIAGTYSPPYRDLTGAEDQKIVKRINQSGAGIVFIGLGCPKQDHFAGDHLGKIEAVQVCVGAAFDFHAGKLHMAPPFMQRHGLEWLFRLYVEPKRLLRRYVTTNSIFVFKLAAAWTKKQAGKLKFGTTSSS